MQTEVVHLNSKERHAIRAFLQKLKDEIGNDVLSVYLFGSRARGDVSPDSDIDLAVLLKEVNPENEKAVRYLAADVWLDSGLFLSTRVWSEDHWHRLKKLQTRLYRNIQREGIDILSALAE